MTTTCCKYFGIFPGTPGNCLETSTRNNQKKRISSNSTLTAALCSLNWHNGFVRYWDLSLGGRRDETLSVGLTPPLEYHWWKSQTQTVLSLLPLAKYRPFGHHFKPHISWRCCWNLIMHSFWRTSYRRISPVLRVPLDKKFHMSLSSSSVCIYQAIIFWFQARHGIRSVSSSKWRLINFRLHVCCLTS